MFLMFLVVASSVFYGRVYCGYLCPQMIFSEASVALEDGCEAWTVKRGMSTRRGAGALFYAVLARRFRRPGLRLHLPTSSSRATCSRRLSRSTSTPPAASPARPSRADVPRLHAGPPALLHHRLPLRLPARHARRRQHAAGPLPRREARVHRMQEVRAGLSHGHRHPQIAVSDRVHPLRRMHRCLRRDPGRLKEARA